MQEGHGEGGAPKSKNAVAKKPQVGPSLEGPSISTRAPTPKPRKAPATMDNDDVVVIPELTLAAPTSSSIPASSTIVV